MRIFFLPPLLDLLRGPHSLRTNGYQRHFPLGQIGRGVKVTTHLHLSLRLRMRGTVSPLPQYTFTVWCLIFFSGYVFIAWYLAKHWDKFTLLLLHIWRHSKLDLIFGLFKDTLYISLIIQRRNTEWLLTMNRWEHGREMWTISSDLFQHLHEEKHENPVRFELRVILESGTFRMRNRSTNIYTTNFDSHKIRGINSITNSLHRNFEMDIICLPPA